MRLSSRHDTDLNPRCGAAAVVVDRWRRRRLWGGSVGRGAAPSPRWGWLRSSLTTRRPRLWSPGSYEQARTGVARLKDVTKFGKYARSCGNLAARVSASQTARCKKLSCIVIFSGGKRDVTRYYKRSFLIVHKILKQMQSWVGNQLSRSNSTRAWSIIIHSV